MSLGAGGGPSTRAASPPAPSPLPRHASPGGSGGGAWRIKADTERAWLRASLGSGGGSGLVTRLAGGGAYCMDPTQARNRFQRTPLHIAADYGWCTAIAVLLEHRADTSAVDTAGDTPAHLASRSGVAGETLRMLCQHPTRWIANMRNKEGDTPLHVAALCRQPASARVLLDENADHTILNRDLRSALDVAEARDSAATVEHIHAAVVRSCAAVTLCSLSAAAACEALSLHNEGIAMARTPAALTARAYEMLQSERARSSLSGAVLPTPQAGGTHSFGLPGASSSGGGGGGGGDGIASFLDAIPASLARRTESFDDRAGGVAAVGAEEEEEEEEEVVQPTHPPADPTTGAAAGGEGVVEEEELVALVSEERLSEGEEEEEVAWRGCATAAAAQPPAGGGPASPGTPTPSLGSGGASAVSSAAASPPTSGILLPGSRRASHPALQQPRGSSSSSPGAVSSEVPQGRASVRGVGPAISAVSASAPHAPPSVKSQVATPPEGSGVARGGVCGAAAGSRRGSSASPDESDASVRSDRTESQTAVAGLMAAVSAVLNKK